MRVSYVLDLADLRCEIFKHRPELFFLLNTCTKFLLTHVSLSLAPSETLRGVAAVSEVAPCSVLINHPQSLHSLLSLSLSLSIPSVPFTTYLSPLPLPPRHSLSLFCYPPPPPLCFSPLLLVCLYLSQLPISPSLSCHLRLPRINTQLPLPSLSLSLFFALLSGLSLEALIISKLLKIRATSSVISSGSAGILGLF